MHASDGAKVSTRLRRPADTAQVTSVQHVVLFVMQVAQLASVSGVMVMHRGTCYVTCCLEMVNVSQQRITSVISHTRSMLAHYFMIIGFTVLCILHGICYGIPMHMIS